MLRLVVAVSIACSVAGTLDLNTEWTSFKTNFNRVYDNNEMYRKGVFARNLDYIRRHNEAADRGQHSYWMGVNQFADMTHEEFKQVMLGLRYNASAVPKTKLYHPSNGLVTLPDSVDWRTKGYVTPVKNQGRCGACWAFSAIGSLEGQHFKNTGKLVSLSEQNLVDCSKKEGNRGCMGGFMDQAFQYIKKNHGIDTEEAYPYTGQDEKCQFKKNEVGATLKGWKDLPKEETALQKAVTEIGPISVGIDASHQSFQFYKKGVLDDPQCSSKILDFAVVVVGYGVEQGHKYWLAKNSWGTDWGDQGYIKMSRDKDNQCGIATMASYPVV